MGLVIAGQIMSVRHWPANDERKMPASDSLTVYVEGMRELAEIKAHPDGWSEGDEVELSVRPFISGATTGTPRIKFQEVVEQDAPTSGPAR